MQSVNKLRVFASTALALVLLLQGALSFADDTEIFLSQAKFDVKPNIFFILDDSNSMLWCADAEWIYPKEKTGVDRCPNKTFRTRADELKDALGELLPTVQDVRFGMMWMNDRKGTGLPVDDIENNRSTALDLINKKSNFRITETPIASSLHDVALYFNGFAEKQYPGNRNFPGRTAKKAFALGKNDDDIPSPIIDSCQPNHIVLMTDGDAWWDDVDGKLRRLIGKNRCVEQPGASSRAAERCVPELAEWLHYNDQIPDPLEGNQTVTVHTVGLALTTTKNNSNKVAKRIQFLKNIANSGGGTYYEALDKTDLVKSFRSIIEYALKIDNATFVNPKAAPTNLQSETDQLYYALFKPSTSDRWLGNLKRYRLGSKTSTHADGKTEKKTVVFDANNIEAFDDDGMFKNNAQSFWSEAPDGPNTDQGGAAWQLPEPAQRKIFVETQGTLGELAISNSNISKTLLNAQDDQERRILLNYIRGFNDQGNAARAKTLGDFLHSQPQPFNYGSREDDQVIIVGSNEGFVHLFNRKTGMEEFAFMPGELLKNIKRLKDNDVSSADNPHPYGVDNTIALWIQENRQKQIEHIYAYVTLRRGGKGMYALDITERNKPKLLWAIKGGEGDFARLGETWSRPVKSKINIAGKIKDVLIFGGGYDSTEDNFNGEKDAYRKDIALGNAIYIVDAKTGAKLWSASRNASNLNLRDMTYSIPSAIRVIDVDNDGLADQLFVGDTGGQVWRLFVHQGKKPHALVTASGLAGNKPFALLGSNNPKNARRFYHEPDIAIDKKGSRRQLMLNIGSGYRAHPLNTQVNDRFYSLRAGLTNDILLPITENDLHPATRSFDNFNLVQAIQSILTKRGWYMPLTIGAGEKVLSTAISANGQVMFSTYVPTTKRVGCQTMLGTNYTYRVNLKSAAPPVKEYAPVLGGIASVTAVHEPLYKENLISGLAGDGFTVIIKGKTYLCFGSQCVLAAPPCEDSKGCKTYWINLED